MKIEFYIPENIIFKEEIDEQTLINVFSFGIIQGSAVLNSKHEETKSRKASFEEKEKEFLEFLIKNSANYFKRKKTEIHQYLGGLKQSLIEHLGEKGIVREIQMKLTYRGSFGVSSTFGQIPFEVGLYIHPYFNVPYIPASSIKGAIRNAYYYYLVNHENENRDKADDECNRLFGDSNFAGLVGFTDAFPIQEGENGYILYPDIINPHYKDAKNEMEVEPKPIIFLTVAPDTTFKFYMYIIKEREKEKRKIEIGAKKDLAAKPIPDTENLGKLDLALLYGLSMGIGAKTALGYSQFVVITYE
jgi:CRISPR type III-B/RAMP module RAMP protein Cmr6